MVAVKGFGYHTLSNQISHHLTRLELQSQSFFHHVLKSSQLSNNTAKATNPSKSHENKTFRQRNKICFGVNKPFFGNTQTSFP